MKLLLDTHTALWALDDPERLGSFGRSLIESPENEILISPVVPWEIAIKIGRGKMAPHALVSDFLAVMQRQNFAFIQVHPLHTIRAGLLPLHHRDPI